MENAMEILTTAEVAAWLKVSKRHVYEMTKQRTAAGVIRQHPLPCVRFGASVRFRRVDIEEWVERLCGKAGVSTCEKIER
jgi:predicted DNA-binding transcriptional regulator AlpA